MVISFLPLTKVVEVDVRFTGPLPTLNSDIEVKPPPPPPRCPIGSALKKSSIRLKLMNGDMKGELITFCGWECRCPLVAPFARRPLWWWDVTVGRKRNNVSF